MVKRNFKAIIFFTAFPLLAFSQEENKKHISISLNSNIGFSSLFYKKNIEQIFKSPEKLTWSSFSGVSASFSISRKTEWEVGIFYGQLNYYDYTRYLCTTIYAHTYNTPQPYDNVVAVGQTCEKKETKISEKVAAITTRPKFYIIPKGVFRLYLSPGLMVSLSMMQTENVEGYRQKDSDPEQRIDESRVYTKNYVMSPFLSFGCGMELFPFKKLGIGIEPLFQTRKLNYEWLNYKPIESGTFFWMASLNVKIIYSIENKKSFKPKTDIQE